MNSGVCAAHLIAGTRHFLNKSKVDTRVQARKVMGVRVPLRPGFKVSKSVLVVERETEMVIFQILTFVSAAFILFHSPIKNTLEFYRIISLDKKAMLCICNLCARRSALSVVNLILNGARRATFFRKVNREAHCKRNKERSSPAHLQQPAFCLVKSAARSCLCL